MTTTTKIWLFALLLLVDLHASSAAEFRPGWTDTFYLQDIKLMSMFQPFQEKIAEHRDPDWDLEDGSKNPVLEAQNLSKPPKFWHTPILCGRGTRCTGWAIRSDNLYLSAFTNKDGEWFRFKVPKGEYEVPDTILLEFNSTYAGLLEDWPKKEGSGNQAWEKLVGMELGQEKVLDSLDVVADYNNQEMARSVVTPELARLIVVFIETQRFSYIRQLVYNAWEDENGGTLDVKGAQLVANWKTISCAILIWDASPDKSIWDSKEVRQLKRAGLDISTPEIAKAEASVILQSEICSK